jgi:molybdopterin converting factor subunit 1
MFLTVRLFARLREIAGAPDLRVEVGDGATVRDVWNTLLQRHTALAPFTSSVSAAVNEEYSRMEAPLRDGDEVAFLPPVSGG